LVGRARDLRTAIADNVLEIDELEALLAAGEELTGIRSKCRVHA
jgi:hypothetical protein